MKYNDIEKNLKDKFFQSCPNSTLWKMEISITAEDNYLVTVGECTHLREGETMPVVDSIVQRYYKG